jgi:hypothetical protein
MFDPDCDVRSVGFRGPRIIASAFNDPPVVALLTAIVVPFEVAAVDS